MDHVGSLLGYYLDPKNMQDKLSFGLLLEALRSYLTYFWGPGRLCQREVGPWLTWAVVKAPGRYTIPRASKSLSSRNML